MANNEIGSDEDTVVVVVVVVVNNIARTAMAEARMPIPNNVADERRRRFDDNVQIRC